MAYIITKSNGQILTTVQNGSVDQTTALTFVGKNYAGYGGIIDQNLYYLLENFSNTTSPTTPVQGQLWFDSKNIKLNVFDGTSYKPLSAASVSTTRPANLANGDFWFNPSNNGLSISYNGNLVSVGGGGASTSNGSSLFLTSMKDVNGVSHLVLNANINTATVFVTSADPAFVTNASDPLYSSFNYIVPGINLSNTNTLNGVSASYNKVSNAYLGTVLFGSASHSIKADSLLTALTPLTSDYRSADISATAGTLVCRDASGNINAGFLSGIASSANSLLEEHNSVYVRGSINPDINTAAVRDGTGALYANSFVGTVSSANHANSAGSLTNGITFNASGAGVAAGTTVNASSPSVVSFNSIGALGTAAFTGNQHLAQNGYQLLPGGLKIAWGITSQPALVGSFAYTYTLPTAFTTVFNAQATLINPTAGFDSVNDVWAQVVSVSKTQITLMAQSNQGVANGYPYNIYYLVIGI